MPCFKLLSGLITSDKSYLIYTAGMSREITFLCAVEEMFRN